jgi:hypothetical protein
MEAELGVASELTKDVLENRARHGGCAPKADALQKLIRGIVSANPGIKEAELLGKLESECPGEVILSIKAGKIEFSTGAKVKMAPISGLKSRFYRARDYFARPKRLNRSLTHPNPASMVRGLFAHLSLSDQQSLEALHSLAGDLTKDVLKEQSSRGGSRPKTDALQKRIIEIVEEHPKISAPQLLATLQAEDFVKSVADGEIEFTDGNATKTADVSGLKDRIYRARKFLCAR